MNPSGFCECGCGNKTNIAPYTRPSRGWVKGEPQNYYKNHNRCYGTQKSYIQRQGKRVHAIVVERVLGKPLPKGAVIHHINGNIKDNRPANLVVCQNRAYHVLLHQRQRAFDASGNADWRKCSVCKQYDSPENLSIPKRSISSPYHKACAALYQRKRRWCGHVETITPRRGGTQLELVP